MSKRFNIFSNDPKNWNVQGVSARNVGILSEHTNSWHLFGTNASKQKSRVSLLKYCLIVFIKSNLAIIFITAAQASGRANFSSLEPFESWSPKKNIESDSLASYMSCIYYTTKIKFSYFTVLLLTAIIYQYLNIDRL